MKNLIGWAILILIFTSLFFDTLKQNGESVWGWILILILVLLTAIYLIIKNKK